MWVGAQTNIIYTRNGPDATYTPTVKSYETNLGSYAAHGRIFAEYRDPAGF